MRMMCSLGVRALRSSLSSSAPKVSAMVSTQRRRSPQKVNANCRSSAQTLNACPAVQSVCPKPVARPLWQPSLTTCWPGCINGLHAAREALGHVRLEAFTIAALLERRMVFKIECSLRPAQFLVQCGAEGQLKLDSAASKRVVQLRCPWQGHCQVSRHFYESPHPTSTRKQDNSTSAPCTPRNTGPKCPCTPSAA